MSDPAGQQHAGADLKRVVAALTRLRGAARAQLFVQRLGLLVAMAFAVALGGGGVDWLLRLPGWLRGGLLLIGGVILIYTFWRHVRPALRFSPSVTEVALRVESLPEAREAGLAGRLASAIELAPHASDADLTSRLSRAAVEDLQERFARLPRRFDLLDSQQLRRTLGALLVIAVPVVALALFAPTMLRIGTARVLTPWSDVSWPKRTGVVDASRLLAHPIDTALPLRAAVTRTNQAPGQTDVSVHFRLVIDGKETPLQRARLSPQRRRISVSQPGGGGVVEGELYERLIEPSALISGLSPASSRIELEYRFETSDDATPVWRTVLVERPGLVGAMATIDPPGYAAAVLGSRPDIARGRKDAGTGRDERGVIGPVLAGSRVRLDLELNKPVPLPPEGDARAAFIASHLAGLNGQIGLTTQLEATRWRIEFVAASSARLTLQLRDEFAIESAEAALFRIDVAEDRPPTAAIVQPASDESVLATAIIPASGEGRDDVALAWIELRSQVATPPQGSIGAAPEAKDAEALLARVEATDAESASQARAQSTLDLGALVLSPGDEVWLTALAADLLGEAEKARGPTLSTVRRLRVISDSELVEQLRAELSGVREAAKRLERDQAALSDDRAKAVDNAQAALDQARRQGALTERIAPMDAVVQRLEERVARNQLADRALSGLLEDARGAVADAAKASQRASEALARMGTGEKAPEEAAQKAQAQTQDALTQLATMLDRGQDSWGVRRALERLIAEQRQLASQTTAAGGQTRGQQPSQLTPQQRDDLSRLSTRQQDLAQRAAAVTEALEQRAEQLKQADAGQAQAMEAAAKRARENRVADTQQDAARQIEQNQTERASQLQEEAAQSLEQMMSELDRSEQRRDEALRRLLADLKESIGRLIREQESELSRLGEAIDGKATPPLDRPMIALHQNTLGVASKAREESREAARIAELLDSAGVSQAAAIVSLRLPDLPEADASERQSLQRLREALDEAQRLDDDAADRDAQRKRAELLKAYQEALELQAAIIGETAPLLERELSRKDRADARALGDRQDDLRASMTRLREQTSELSESGLFDFAHTRLDHAAARAASVLREGRATAGVGRDQQTVARLLRSLLEALRQDQPQKDQFRDAEEGGGGEGGGGGQSGNGLIPPIAELKLLRMMQEEAIVRTRDLGERPDAGQIDEIANLQRELSRRGDELMQRMTPNAPRPGAEDPEAAEPELEEPTP